MPLNEDLTKYTECFTAFRDLSLIHILFPQEVLDDFEKETGVKVVYSNFDTDETMLEKLSMAKGGDYDIVIADDYILETAIQEGLAEKLDKDSLENIGNINPLYQGPVSYTHLKNRIHSEEGKDDEQTD